MKRLLLLAGIYCLAGCKKNETAAASKPQVIINTPSASQHFVKGDTIRITGTVTHTAAILEVAVHMTSLSTGNEFFHNHFSAGNLLQYNFSSVYGIPDLNKATYKVEVEATDKDGNTGTKELAITVN
ncbi:MAG: DUF4625 domain-containing protein [Ferruginibacter sp.]